MRGQLVQIITSTDAAARDLSLDAVCEELDLPQILVECNELEKFRRESTNLYERVRAAFFLYAIHRFHVPRKPGAAFGERIESTSADDKKPNPFAVLKDWKKD